MADKNQEAQMSFLAHLEVLRWHLIRSVVAIVLVAIFAFIYKEFVFDTVVFAPKKPDFVTFRLLCAFSHWLNASFPTFFSNPDVICMGQNIPPLQNITMAGQFTTHIIVSLVSGLVVAFPYVFWELWRFVKPALQSKEKNYTRFMVLSASSLFTIGVVFGYFIIAPMSVNFLATYSVSKEVGSIPTLSSYISTVTTIVLACGVVFELPMIVFLLTKIGILSPKLLKRFWRHAIVVSLILSAIITPPDVFSQLLVSLPLLILYWVSIYISAAVYRKREKREAV